MRVLIGCETSGVVREAFRALGHEAYSCDLLPAQDNSRFHIQADLNMVLNYPQRVIGHLPRRLYHWDLLIAHPTCTYLCNSGVSRLTGNIPPNPSEGVLYGPARWEAMHQAAYFFGQLRGTRGADRVCLENPVMHGYAREAIGGPGPDQYVQPYMFGDDASKLTGLHLRGLAKLAIPPKEAWYPPRLVLAGYKRGNREPHPARYYKRWSNQTDSGQNKLPPSADRWQLRSNTYPGIARAMAQQWGGGDVTC